MKLSLNQVVGLITVRSDFFTSARMAVIGHEKSDDKDYEPSQADIDRLGEYLDQTYGQIGKDKPLIVDIFGLQPGQTAEQVEQEYRANTYQRHAEACEVVVKIASLLDLARPRPWRDL